MPFTVTMPKLSPTMETGTIVKWHKKVGDKVESGDLLLEISTDKATVEHNALDEGWLRQIVVKEGEEAGINHAIAIFTEEKNESIEGYKPEGEVAEPTLKEEVEKTPAKEARQTKGAGLAQPEFLPEPPLEKYTFNRPREMLEKRVVASPLAKKLAKDKGVELTTVKGSGPHGRIVSEDVDKAQPSGALVFGSHVKPSESPGSYEEIPMSQMRKSIGRRLQEAKTFIPHFYVSQTIDAASLVEIREQLHHMKVKVSLNDFVVRACALALRDHPHVNCGFNSVNQSIIQFKTIDIAVAVTVDGGLITPIVRHADFKNLGELSAEIRYLANKAREGKLEPEEYKGGSFTISNLGMYGVTDFSAIINPPQAAILAVSAVKNVPVVKNGHVVPGKTMHLTLSADHRVIDGVLAAQFITTVQKYLENPAVLIV